MSSEAQLGTVYADDESIAIRAYADFATLVPKDQVLAAASDGVFGPSDPWTLTSASSDFVAQGLQVGHVVQITGPKPDFTGAGSLFAVGAVTTNSLTLRRLGKGDGMGLPPATADGLNGVTFTVKTFDPQIEDATFEINQKFSIDPTWATLAPDAIDNLRVLRQATILTVLARAYATSSHAKNGDFDVKAITSKQALSEALSIVEIRWTKSLGVGASLPPPTSRFSTRIGR